MDRPPKNQSSVCTCRSADEPATPPRTIARGQIKSTPTHLCPAQQALGRKPISSALASDMTSIALAPSVRNEELAAVWVPWGLKNAGFKDVTLAAVAGSE